MWMIKVTELLSTRDLRDVVINSEHIEYMFDDEWFRSTLCYPLTVDPYQSENSIIYYVHWFTDEKYILDTYKLINEEWFHQGLFEVIKED